MTDTELLKKLLSHFSLNGGGLDWRYMEGVLLGQIDPELEKHLIEFLRKNHGDVLSPVSDFVTRCG